MKQKKRFESVINKKARFDYEVLDSIEAGLVLTGPEVKAIRIGQVNLKDSFVRVSGGKATVHNLTIQPYKFAEMDEEYDPKRTRNLLLHQKEIMALQGKSEQKQISLVPLKLYQKHRRFKLEVGIVRGKKQYQKKEVKKRRDLDREMQRDLKFR